MIITNAKILVFDMDGTIADLYGVENWLDSLRASDPSPYINAQPLVDMDSLNELLNILKDCGWRIVVTTWLSKDSTKEYDMLVREAKLAWLEKYHFPYDEIHLVKYGTTKADCTRKYGYGSQVLVDDNEKILNGWNLGRVINASTENILQAIAELLTD